MKLWNSGTAVPQQIDSFTVGNDREIDMHLAVYDCQASAAHAKMLAHVGLLAQDEADQLVKALQKIEAQATAGELSIEEAFEDIHSKIEYELIQALGPLGKKIHMGRSRNDQVLTALQLYIKAELNAITSLTEELFNALLELAETHQKDLMPGYTHMQVAMPSSFGLWFSAYAEALIDDIYLLQTAHKLADQNPLGSAAGFGSSFAIDREMTTKTLGFGDLSYNVIKAQMGRGKVEKATATGISYLAATLSKFAMDICLYMGQDYGFIRFPDALTTGSSIMPHKKNPDVFELIRGKCNLLQGLPNQLSLLCTNLPSGYHRELQLTKTLLINGINELKSCLELFLWCIPQIEVQKNLLEASKYDSLFSVDTLNVWVQEGMHFRDAYQKMKTVIASGEFKPNKDIPHTHLGSRGNLALAALRKKMAAALQ